MDIFTSAEFWAAIVGALVGGLIAAVTQWIFARSQRKEQRKDREQQKLDRDQALATSLMFKLTDVAASLIVTRQHVEQCFAVAVAENVGPDTQPWQMLRPLVNISDPVHFTSDEMSVLLAQANDKVFGQVLLLDNRHNSNVAALRMFNALRKDLDERMLRVAIIDRIDGDRVDMRFPEEAIRNLRPRMIELNSIVQHLRDDLPKDALAARVATEDALNLFRKNLSLKFNVKIKDPPSNAPASGA